MVINESTKLKLQEAIKLRTQKDQQPKVKAEDDGEDDEEETDPVETVFDTRENRDADSFGRSVATAVASWGLLEAWKGGYGGGRWVASVTTTDHNSMVAESEDKALSKAVK